MSQTDLLLEKVDGLSPDYMSQIFDFIDQLKRKAPPSAQVAAVEKPPRRYESKPFPTIEELKAEAHAKYLKRIETGVDSFAKFAGTMKDVFTEDGVTYQRRMRNEWPD
ncbi:hypothetical protein FACS1894200_12760 [Spirochaetia bacterium]|nr:hypothetical protein FACS1894200_12760 [Spirochaetia bacterium]